MLPRDLRVSIAELVRDLARCFTDDSQRANDGMLMKLARRERFRRQPAAELQRVPCREKNIEQQRIGRSLCAF